MVTLFAAGIASFSIFPLKDFIFTSGWQNALAWGTLIFFILVPIIGIITWVIRKITKVKTGSKTLRLSFIAMWVVGWVCVIFLLASISKDFKYNSNLNTDEVAILDPNVNALDISNAKSGINYSRSWFGDNDFFDLSDDDESATVRNVKVNIEKSSNDSFKVSMLKYACGKKVSYADSLASLINFNIQQKDSSLILDRGVMVNTKDKFRNQRVIVTIYVPVGKKIRVQNNIGWLNQIQFNGLGFQTSSYDDLVFENIEQGWETGVWYTMTKDGLYTLNGKPASNYKKNGVKINDDGIDVKSGKQRIRINDNGILIDENNVGDNNDDESGTYRYDEKATTTKFDSMRLEIKKQEKKYKDSLEEAKKKISASLNHYNDNNKYNVKPSNLLVGIFN